jgi:hypothetical protein
LQVNIHQLAYSAGYVWAVSPWTNSLIGVCCSSDADAVEFDLRENSLRHYIERAASDSDDRWHFNSLLWTGEHLFVAAHAFGGTSFINRYDAATLELNKVYSEVGASVHGLAFYADELIWISTNTQEIRSESGYRQPLGKPGYARGFAMTSGQFIVATSEFLSRGNRHAGDSWIQVIDRHQGLVLKEFHLADTGSINDLRLLDEYDYAHGVDPFWSGRRSTH